MISMNKEKILTKLFTIIIGEKYQKQLFCVRSVIESMDQTISLNLLELFLMQPMRRRLEIWVVMMINLEQSIGQFPCRWISPQNPCSRLFLD